jgi:putative MFS transporter
MANKIPRHRRGAAAMAVSVVALLAVPATIFFVRWLTQLQLLGWDGWRWALAVNGIGAILYACLLQRVPEPPDVRDNVLPGADAARPAALLHDPASRRALVVLLLLSLLVPWPTIGFPVMSGAVMVQKGFDLSNSLLYLGVSFLGPIVSNIVVAFLVDRTGRRPILIASAATMALLSPVFAVLDTFIGLMVTGLIFTMAAAAFVPVFLLYAAESFPPENRASAAALAWAVNRGTAAVVPLVLLAILRSGGPVAMLGMISLTLVAVIGILAAGSRSTNQSEALVAVPNSRPTSG